MYREIEQDLINWKLSVSRKPLLVRGARQVGKTYTVEAFGEEHFESLITINFELSPEFIPCFENLDPEKIIDSIEILTKKEIILGKTLLFLDEIQLCPRAILALRYFKEKCPKLHVIGAGSFLEFVINEEQYQAPVGRVQSLFMRPCSFKEFLFACGENKLISYLSTVTINNPINNALHQHLLQKVREYFIIGGMPEAISTYIENQKLYGIDKIHFALNEYYRRDFSKYGHKINHAVLQKIFLKAPGFMAKRFKYVDVAPDIAAREQKPALDALLKAGILHKVNHTSANGLPFYSGINEKKFKLLLLDIGLAQASLGLDLMTLQHEHLILLNRGALAEQFVGQELLVYESAYKDSQLFYWEREKTGSSSEIDYLINLGPTIVPIEVKSGKTGRLKSLQVFLDEKGLDLGVRISQSQFSFERRILSIPLYMIFEMKRLLETI